MYHPLLLCCIAALLTVFEAVSGVWMNEDCASLQQCQQFLPQHAILTFFNEQSMEHYTRTCRDKVELNRCFNDNKDLCQGSASFVNYQVTVAAVNFFCSTEGQQGLPSLMTSPCFNANTLSNVMRHTSCLGKFVDNWFRSVQTPVDIHDEEGSREGDNLDAC
ncbi:hypothetical protein BgiMline_019666, partial [Biomphalaria glabrata]